MLRKKELQWFYQYGASEIYPEAWKGFIDEIPEDKRHDLIEAYRQIFTGEDKGKKLSAAKAWSKWEASTSFIKGFLENENQLLENIDVIRHIPAVIIQGRYDVVCPPATAYELYSKWPEADLKIAPFSGHSAFEKEITHLLIEATNKFSKDL